MGTSAPDRLYQRAMDAVWHGALWLSAEELGQRFALRSADPSMLVNQWVQERRIFAVERDGLPVFPGYALDMAGHPLPAMQTILGILDGSTRRPPAEGVPPAHGRCGGQ